MNAHCPLVSVVVPVYNGERTIARAIDSGFAQQCEYPIEIVVANDGSIDGTAELLKRYGDRIRVLDLPNRGPAAARNAAVGVSQGEYVAFLDADDWWMPRKLAVTIPQLEQSNDYALAYADAIQVDLESRVLTCSYFPIDQPHDLEMSDLLREPVHIQPSTIVLRRSAFDDATGFSEEFGPGFIACEDTFFLMRVRERGKFIRVDEPLGYATVGRSFGEMMSKRSLWRTSAPASGAQWTPTAYLHNYETFIRLVRARYGSTAQPLVRKIRRVQSNLLTTAALGAIAIGDVAGARNFYMHALRKRPLDVKTHCRLCWTFLPRGFARHLSTLIPDRLARALAGPTE